MGELTQWQRLSPVSVLFTWLIQVQKLVRENLWLMIGAGAGVAFTDWLSAPQLLGVFALLLGLMTLYAVLDFLRFHYRLDEEAVEVRRGVLVRKVLRVPFARIQQVDLNVPIYYRPLQLVSVALQTPGAAEQEVVLPGINQKTANAMLDVIEARKGHPSQAVSPAQTDALNTDGLSPCYEVSASDLFWHGVCANQVWVLGGALAYVVSQLGRRWGEVIEAQLSHFLGQVSLHWSLAIALFLGLLVLLFALSGLVAMLRWWGFTLLQSPERIQATAGWLNRRQQGLQRSKVTGLSWRQSLVGRALDRWSLVLRQTRSDDQALQASRASFLVPGLRGQQLDLADVLWANHQPRPPWQPIHPRYLRVGLLRVLLLVMAMTVLVLWWRSPEPWIPVLLWFMAMVWMAWWWLRFRCWAWAAEGDDFWLRSGGLGQRIERFAVSNAQQVQLRQSWIQRRHHLATVVWVLPHGTVTLPWIDQDLAVTLINDALWRSQSSKATSL